jgi:hypothetical protein
MPGTEPEDAGAALPAVVKLPAALLDPAAGDIPTRWGSSTPSYVSAELRAAAVARVVPPLPAPDAPPPPRPAMHYPLPASAPLPGAASGPTAAPVAAPPMTASSPLAGTAEVNIGAIVTATREDALPFAHPQSSHVGVSEMPAKRSATEVRSRPVGSGTVEADVNAAVGDERSALPFIRAERPGQGPAETGEDLDLSLLPLETYASVSGALARGDSREATLKRYGLTAPAFDIFARAWAQRFQREPSLLEKFKELARSSAAGRRDEGQR